MVEPDPDQGLRGTTTKNRVTSAALQSLLTDVALGKQSSRTLNTNNNIRDYFESWDAKERPASKADHLFPRTSFRVSPWLRPGASRSQ